MRHNGTQTLETDRLILRRITPKDAPAMFQNWACDPQVTRYLRWNPHSSAAETHTILSAWYELYPNADYYQWGIEEKATGTLIGTISIFDDRPNAASAPASWHSLHPDGSAGIWMPGYCIGKAWWNKGYTTEALQAVVRYWFTVCGGEWLACCHEVHNPASGRVMEHAGFAADHDGEDHKFDGTPVTCKYYYLTRTMWETRNKE